MRSFWREPYLWVHLAGIFAAPIFLGLCLFGLAIAPTGISSLMKILVVAIVGILPILWMQWQRPFYIFSLVILTVRPDYLTLDQRRILQLFKAPTIRIITGVMAVGMVGLLCLLDPMSQLLAQSLPANLQDQMWGLAIAAIAFLGVNLFVQVPASVVGILLNRQDHFESTCDCPLDQVPTQFTIVGKQGRSLFSTLNIIND